MHLPIRTKLVLFAALPVIAVYLLLFLFGVTQLRAHLTDDAHDLLLEHARYRAAQFALSLSQAPALAESLGDLMQADPDQDQSLLYAHLIDGLRRTPLAQSAGILYAPSNRSALMRRGQPGGETLSEDDVISQMKAPGWHIESNAIVFYRALDRAGERVGETFVNLSLNAVYQELSAERSSSNMILMLADDNGQVRLPDPPPLVRRQLADSIGSAGSLGSVSEIRSGLNNDDRYWLVSTQVPGLPWRILAATPTETALMAANEKVVWVAGILVVSLLVVMSVIAAIAHRITRPFAALDASVQQIGRGDFNVDPDVKSHDELGALASAIRSMAQHIAHREQQLRRSHQVLEHRVAERTTALRQSNTKLIEQIEENQRTEVALRSANEQAQQASKAKSQFLSNMSHELRTPLHGVLGYAQLLRRDGELNQAQRESVEAIERCGQHLLTLINDILDLTKIEAGRMQVDLQPVDLGQLIDDVRTIVASRAAAENLVLRIDVGTDIPAIVMTDAVKLKQILLNLLGNALKFTEQGVVSLSVCLDAEGQIRFEVADTGVGVPADKLEAIFDAFSQARDGKAVDGTGLGLAINQRLIRLLGGSDFNVDSTPGIGSRFHFRLPNLAPPDDAQPVVLSVDHHPAAAVQTLLWLAAESREPLDVKDALADKGFVIQRMQQIGQAAAYLEQHLVAGVIVELDATDDAAGMCATLHQAARYGPPPIIAVGDTAVASVAVEAGFDVFLQHPLDASELSSQLESHARNADPMPAPPTAAPRQITTAWSAELAQSTAARLHSAIDLGDVAHLFQLAEELADHPAAPTNAAEEIALMARLFDFDGLRRLASQLDTLAGPAASA